MLFAKLHDFVAPFVKKRYQNFINSPKKMKPKRKLESKEEFFIVLIKLQLYVLMEDLSD